MRVAPLPPDELPSDRAALHADMRAGIHAHFSGFVAERSDGALLGPWAPWLAFPEFGGPVWELTKAMVTRAKLPGPVREVAILVTGAHFRAAYELYAHVIVAEHRGLADDKLATIVAGERPAELTAEERVAYDFAASLVRGGVLPELTWRQAVRLWGEAGAAELVNLVGLYALVSVTLNGFDVTVPDEAAPA